MVHKTKGILDSNLSKQVPKYILHHISLDLVSCFFGKHFIEPLQQQVGRGAADT